MATPAELTSSTFTSFGTDTEYSSYEHPEPLHIGLYLVAAVLPWGYIFYFLTSLSEQTITKRLYCLQAFALSCLSFVLFFSARDAMDDENCILYSGPIYCCFVMYFLTTFAAAAINLVASLQNKKSMSTIYSIAFLKFELVLQLVIVAVAVISSFLISDLGALIFGFGNATCWYFTDYFGYIAFSLPNGLLILLSIVINIGTIVTVLVKKFVNHTEGAEKIEDEPTAGYFDATYRTNVYFFAEVLESFVFILCNAVIYVVFHFVISSNQDIDIWRGLGIALSINGLILFFLAVINTSFLITRLVKQHFCTKVQ